MEERVEAAKYSSQAQVEIFCMIIHRSLSINVGRPTSHISRHVAAIGPRIILLSIGLSLLQSTCLFNMSADQSVSLALHCMILLQVRLYCLLPADRF